MGSFDLFGFLPFGLLDLIDILLVAFLLYRLYELVKGTIAIRIFVGVISIYLLWLLVTALQMQLMSQIFRQFINVGVIALIIVFQQEIRRFLLAIGMAGKSWVK
jgi:diadenylate cyclase